MSLLVKREDAKSLIEPEVRRPANTVASARGRDVPMRMD